MVDFKFFGKAKKATCVKGGQCKDKTDVMWSPFLDLEFCTVWSRVIDFWLRQVKRLLQ